MKKKWGGGGRGGGGGGGGREEVRQHLAAQFKGRPIGGKFITLQETFSFQSVTNLKLLVQVQQFLCRPLGGICFSTPTWNNDIKLKSQFASNKLQPSWTLHRDSLQVVQQKQNGVSTFIAGTGLLLCTTNGLKYVCLWSTHCHELETSTTAIKIPHLKIHRSKMHEILRQISDCFYFHTNPKIIY